MKAIQSQYRAVQYYVSKEGSAIRELMHPAVHDHHPTTPGGSHGRAGRKRPCICIAKGSQPMNIRLGVDLGGTKTEIIALDDAGNALLRRRVRTPAGDYYATLAAVKTLVAEADAVFGQRYPIGVGTPGSASPFPNHHGDSRGVRGAAWLAGLTD